MKIKKSLYLANIFLSFFLLTGCDNFLEEEPVSFIAPENLYTSEEGAISGVNGIYDILNFLGASRREHYLMTEVTSDDAQYTRGDASRVELSNFNHDAANGNVSFVWRNLYVGISRANMVIARVPNIDMDETLKARLLGRLIF